jgi:Flp pilus assembly protein TadD
MAAINKKAKIEKNVATKKQLETQAKDLSTKVIELNKKAAQYQSKAEADYFKAIDLNPSDGATYYNRGIARVDLGQTDLACSDFNKALGLGIREAAVELKETCEKN